LLVATFFFLFANRFLMVLMNSIFPCVQPIVGDGEETDGSPSRAAVMAAVRSSSVVSPFRRNIIALESLRMAVGMMCGDAVDNAKKDSPSTALLSSFFFVSEYISPPFGLSSLLLLFSFLSNAFDSVRLLARDILMRLFATREGLSMLSRLRMFELKASVIDPAVGPSGSKHRLLLLDNYGGCSSDSLLIRGLHHYLDHFLSMPSFLLPSFLSLSSASAQLILNALSTASSTSPPILLLSLIHSVYDSDAFILVDVIAMKIVQLLLTHAILLCEVGGGRGKQGYRTG
jgi:hypothetical protein